MFRNFVDCSYKYLRQQLAPAAVAISVYMVPAAFFAMASAVAYGYVGHNARACSCFYLRCSAVGNGYGSW